MKLITLLYTAAAAVSAVLLVSPWWPMGAALWAVTYLPLAMEALGVLRRSNWKTLNLPYRTARVLLIIGALGPVAYVHREGEVWGDASILICALMFVLIPEAVSVGQKLGIAVARLPGTKIPRTWSRPLAIGNSAMLLAPVIAMGLAFTGAHGLWFVPMTLVLLVTGILVLRHGWNRRVTGMTAIQNLPARLEEYGPKFILYWGAEPGSRYQLDMWIPQLKRLKIPFVIFLRNPATFAEAVRASQGAPVIEVSRLRDLEWLIPSTATTVFYVNNSANNAHMVRYSHLTHIQLLHGDSEKRSSFNPVVNMYDRIYVSGQAAIDRYRRNGVVVPVEKFSIVGRPQLKAIRRERAHISSKAPPTVLYAPTWRGDFADTEHSSLLFFEETLDALLARKCRVIFRPHPYSKRQSEAVRVISRVQQTLAAHSAESGVQHLFAEAAESELSLYECFNESDALITDVSSVVTDYLISGKPYALMVPDVQTKSKLKKLRIFQAAYLLSQHEGAAGEELDRMLQRDPLRKKRVATRSYYLGNIPAKGYTFRFVDIATRDIFSPASADKDSLPLAGTLVL